MGVQIKSQTATHLYLLITMKAQIILFCYLILSPTVFSFTIPKFFQDVIEKRQGNIDLERTFDVPDNVLEVAAVGFLAGLAGSLFSLPANTATTTTTTTTTTTPAPTGRK